MNRNPSKYARVSGFARAPKRKKAEYDADGNHIGGWASFEDVKRAAHRWLMSDKSGDVEYKAAHRLIQKEVAERKERNRKWEGAAS